jgi:hypothetical protein
MIRLDTVNFTLFELAPVPYEVYMKTYGCSDTLQVITRLYLPHLPPTTPPPPQQPNKQTLFGGIIYSYFSLVTFQIRWMCTSCSSLLVTLVICPLTNIQCENSFGVLLEAIFIVSVMPLPLVRYELKFHVKF